MTAVISIGGAALRVIGLSPQSVESDATGRVVVTPTFGGNDIQMTGADPTTFTIEAETSPQLMGGLDAYAILEALRKSQAPVPYMRMEGNFRAVNTGTVIVQELNVKESKLSPWDGRGRRMTVTVTLTRVGNDGSGWLGGLI